MKLNKKILILDDTNWHYIYKNLNNRNNKFSFHVRGNIIDPIKYYKYIIKTKPDIIIMNTWYKGSSVSTPKWISLLERLVWYYWQNKEIYNSSFFWLIKSNKHNELKMSWFNSKIIYVCDMWKHNKSRFSVFKHFPNISFVPEKDIDEILTIINNN